MTGACSAVLMLTAGLAADESLEALRRKELALLAGTWQLVAAETDGKKSSPEQVAKIRVVIKDSKHSVFLGDKTVVKEIDFVIDPTQSPRTTDDRLGDGRVIRGIYELSGDTLRSCVAAPDKDRPTEFSALAGSGHTLRLFQRVVAATGDDAALRRAVSFYASFDELPKGDRGGGKLTLATRFNHETEPGKFVFQDGFDAKLFRVAPDKGIAGGALEVVDVLPRNGRVFFPVKGNLAYRPDGWSGALSVWINTDPNTQLKTKFCDPIQITQRGANNGGIWFDFNDARPRDLRLGVFPAVAAGQKPMAESDADAPMVRVPAVNFKAGEWHHVVLSWENLDTGRPDARASLYIDGKLQGTIKDRPLAMAWDIDKAGIYTAVNFIGLLDEFALFSRALTADEIGRLMREPGCLR